MKTDPGHAARSDNSAAASNADEVTNHPRERASAEELTGSSENSLTENRSKQRVTNLDFQSDKANEKPVVPMGMYIAIILLSIPIPPIGMAMGYTYLRKSHPDAKKAGKIWLIWGIITFAILVLLTII
ncbi:pilin [Nitrosomonas sp. Nm51]|uniref:pilin n=1 Tax=Nitrosomonas sp. Nm51 TaxID=133720 RepID=UPI00115FD817|nr:pilin [Nitrosomonas sp. Nm51]